MRDTCNKVWTPGGHATHSHGVWQIARDDGRAFVWDGFYTGPRALDRQQLAAAATRLLGVELADVPAAAARSLRPPAGDARRERAIILHSATPDLRSLQADLADAESGHQPDDVATYVEARAVSLAQPGDVVVGRTEPWRLAAELERIEAVTIPGIDFYYLSQAIISLALESDGKAPQLARLAGLLRDRPDTIVRVYALDVELQIVLLTLMRLAGLDEIRTDANGPQVATIWNAKAPLYPAIGDALTVRDGPRSDPRALLEAETKLSKLQRLLGVRAPVLPGYVIDAEAVCEEAFAQQLTAAARRLRERYGLARGCLKPSQAGAGARIVSGIALADEDGLRVLAARAWTSREAYVLEAHVDYLRRPVAGRELPIAPSGHIRNGNVAEGLTLQLTNGTSWQGNVFLDADTCDDAIGLTTERYDAITRALAELHAGFARAGAGLVTAGFDFAVGRIGGVFGSEVLVALQDPNISSHGAEYLRHYLDGVRAAGGPRYGATKVICPARGQALPVLRALVEDDGAAPGALRVMSAIPGRWGMIAIAADSPVAAVEAILRCERGLQERGAIMRVAGR